jgi:hypothetical protein
MPPNFLISFVLFTDYVFSYLKVLMSLKISLVFSLIMSIFVFLMVFLTGLNLANSKMSMGRSIFDLCTFE